MKSAISSARLPRKPQMMPFAVFAPTGDCGCCPPAALESAGTATLETFELLEIQGQLLLLEGKKPLSLLARLLTLALQFTDYRPKYRFKCFMEP